MNRATQDLLPAKPTTVDLWWMDASRPGESEAELEMHLSASERAKLPTLRHLEVRRHRRFFRARQRQILALYTGLSPAAHEFDEGAHGKPFLSKRRLPNYNLTHSGEYGILAVTGAEEVGVDLEVTTRRTECLQLADRFFAPSEAAALRALPTTEQRAAFFTGWVRKEAWIKALGTGLSTPLDDFQVSLDPDQRAAWMLNTGPTGDAEEWTYATPSSLPDANCLAAVAVRGSGIKPRWRNFADFIPPQA